jgi:hypothetical protein
MIFDLIKKMYWLSKKGCYPNNYDQWIDLHSTTLKEITKTKLSDENIKKIFLSPYYIPELIAEELISRNKTSEVTKRLYLMRRRDYE